MIMKELNKNKRGNALRAVRLKLGDGGAVRRVSTTRVESGYWGRKGPQDRAKPDWQHKHFAKDWAELIDKINGVGRAR